MLKRYKIPLKKESSLAFLVSHNRAKRRCLISNRLVISSDDVPPIKHKWTRTSGTWAYSYARMYVCHVSLVEASRHSPELLVSVSPELSTGHRCPRVFIKIRTARERERGEERRDGISRMASLAAGGMLCLFPFLLLFFFFTFLPCPSTSLPVGNKPFIQAPRPDCGDKSASGTPSANHRSSFPFETSHRRVKEIGSRSLRRSVLLPGISCRGIRALVYSSSRRAGKGGRRWTVLLLLHDSSPSPFPPTI